MSNAQLGGKKIFVNGAARPYADGTISYEQLAAMVPHQPHPTITYHARDEQGKQVVDELQPGETVPTRHGMSFTVAGTGNA